MTSWNWINGNFVEADRAVVSLNDLALQRGYGLFDFFRTRDGKPLFLQEHLNRFFNSAKLLYLQPPIEKEALKTIVLQLIKKNNLSESGVKLTLTGGYSSDGYTPTTPNLIIQQNEIRVFGVETFQQGIKIITYPYQRELPQAKTTNYLIGIWLQKQLQACGADEVLYQSGGIITEFPRANVFIVTKDNKLITPFKNILHGVTRGNVLKIAQELFVVEERDILVEELKLAQEVFLTSTTKRLLPVFEIDGTPLSRTNPITRVLYREFLKLEEAELTKQTPGVMA